MERLRDKLLVLHLVAPTKERRVRLREPLCNLGQIYWLRLLSIHFCPPLDQLQKLKQLRELRILKANCISPDLTRVIRYLSTRHQLIAVSLSNRESTRYVDAALLNLVAGGELLTESGVFAAVAGPEAHADTVLSLRSYEQVVPLPSDALLPLPPAALEEFTLSYPMLTPSQFETVCAMPRLRQLSCSLLTTSDPDSQPSFTETSSHCYPQLRHLNFRVHEVEAWYASFFPLCRDLRSLRLRSSLSQSWDTPIDLDLNLLPSTLEDIHLQNVAVLASSWLTLAHMTRLEEIYCGHLVAPQPDLAILAPVLGALPRFTSLTLGLVPEWNFFRLPANLLPSVAASQTWREIRLPARANLWSIHTSDALLPSLTLLPDSDATRRFRIVLDKGEPMKRYRAGTRGEARAWLEDP